MNAARKVKEAKRSGTAPAAETRRVFPTEYKREAVRLALVGDRSVRAVAQALDRALQLVQDPLALEASSSAALAFALRHAGAARRTSAQIVELLAITRR